MNPSVVTISGGLLWPGAVRGQGRALGLAVVSCRSGAAEVSGVPAGPQGRRAAMRSSLEAGGAAPYTARRPSGGERRRQPPPLCPPLAPGAWSGRRRGQELIQRLSRGLPAQGLARPGVQLISDRGQVLRAVHRQVRALGEVLAQQPVGVLVRAALPGRMRVAEVDVQV